MKIRKTFLYILTITILGSTLSLIIIHKEDFLIEPALEDNFIHKNVVKNNIVEGKIKNLQFKYPVNTEFEINEDRYKILNTNYGYVVKDTKNEITRNNYFDIKFFSSAQGNPHLLNSEDYYFENRPGNERQAASPDIEQSININGIDAYEAIYSSMASELGSDYYDVVSIYITHGSDEYEIWGYKLPEHPSPDLTPADIAAAKEYEKIFDQVLQTISFLK